MSKIYTIFFVISVVLVTASLGVLAVYGLNFGVDFRGGSLMEIEFSGNRPAVDQVTSVLKENLSGAGDFSVSYIGDDGMIIRAEELSESQHQAALGSINSVFASLGGDVKEKRFDSIGPVIGQELKEKSIVAIIIVLLAVILYIALVFRKMSIVLSPWAMGMAAIVALFHDIVVPLGIFSLLGHLGGIEISAVFVAAILTILGYSVSDTVVVFDRVRENVIKNKARENFGAVVQKSVLQTLTRSLNTTFTTLLSLVAIYLFGGESLKYFTLLLIMGIFFGAYSSIFVASPLLVFWSGLVGKRR